MSEQISFPQPAADADGPAESTLIIEIFSGALFTRGGAVSYADVTPWKRDANLKASPFVGIVIEFSCDTAQTIGDGTALQAIGLFGEIDGIGKFLLGYLGINQGTAVPQIPIAATTVGFAQIVADVALYDRLSVGAVNQAEIEFLGELTITARPIRDRFYEG